MSGGRWSDLGRRSLSAAVLAPVALLGVAQGGAAFDLLIIALALGVTWEWVGLWRGRSGPVPGVLVAAGVAAAGLGAALMAPGLGLATACAGAVACRATGAPTLMALGPLYVGVPEAALISLRQSSHGRELVLFLMLVVWACDVGAYLIGRLVGGRLLAPAISPGKTWSGAVGGLGVALLAGWAAHVWLGVPAPWVAVPLAVAAQAGDLLESGIKRHVGVKDSGRWIPGHGGLLDRLDGLLAAAPLLVLIAWGGV